MEGTSEKTSIFYPSALPLAQFFWQRASDGAVASAFQSTHPHARQRTCFSGRRPPLCLTLLRASVRLPPSASSVTMLRQTRRPGSAAAQGRRRRPRQRGWCSLERRSFIERVEVLDDVWVIELRQHPHFVHRLGLHSQSSHCVMTHACRHAHTPLGSVQSGTFHSSRVAPPPTAKSPAHSVEMAGGTHLILARHGREEDLLDGHVASVAPALGLVHDPLPTPLVRIRLCFGATKER